MTRVVVCIVFSAPSWPSYLRPPGHPAAASHLAALHEDCGDRHVDLLVRAASLNVVIQSHGGRDGHHHHLEQRQAAETIDGKKNTPLSHATRNKCIATSNRCLTSSNKKLVETLYKQNHSPLTAFWALETLLAL